MRDRIFAFCLLTIVTFFAVASSGDEPSIEMLESNETASNTLVVMVHGLFGGGVKGTWGEGADAWYKRLREEEALKSADILVYDYPTSLTEKQPIAVLAADLADVLASNNIDDYDSVVFLAHSMGGIVVKKFLVDNRDFISKTRFVYLFGTPSSGIGFANIVSIGGWHGQISNLQKANYRDNFIERLGAAWSRVAQKIAVYCGYEGERVGPIYVVPYESGTHGCTRPIQRIAGDHFQIVKPFMVSNDPLPHYMFLVAYQTEIKDTHETATIPIIAIDSKEYRGSHTASDNPIGTNGDEIQNILRDRLGLGFEKVAVSRAWPYGWDGSLVISLKPELIFLHWSAFEEGTGSDSCYLSGSNIRAGSCQRLLANLKILLKSTSAVLAIYTRTRSACVNAKMFFENDIALKSIGKDLLSRIVIIDLELGGRNKSFLEDKTREVISNAGSILRSAGWRERVPEIGKGVCRVVE